MSLVSDVDSSVFSLYELQGNIFSHNENSFTAAWPTISNTDQSRRWNPSPFLLPIIATTAIFITVAIMTCNYT